MEFLSFCQISIPIFWVPPPSPIKPLSPALPVASLNPGTSLSLHSPPSVSRLKPHLPPWPFSRLWSPWPPLYNLWFFTYLSGHLFSASSTNSLSVSSQWQFIPKVLKQVPSLLCQSTFPEWSCQPPQLLLSSISLPFKKLFQAEKRVELKSFQKGNSQYLPEGKKEMGEERAERA